MTITWGPRSSSRETWASLWMPWSNVWETRTSIWRPWPHHFGVHDQHAWTAPAYYDFRWLAAGHVSASTELKTCKHCHPDGILKKSGLVQTVLGKPPRTYRKKQKITSNVKSEKWTKKSEKWKVKTGLFFTKPCVFTGFPQKVKSEKLGVKSEKLGVKSEKFLGFAPGLNFQSGGLKMQTEAEELWKIKPISKKKRGERCFWNSGKGWSYCYQKCINYFGSINLFWMEVFHLKYVIHEWTHLNNMFAF